MVIIKARQPLSTKISVKDFKSRFSGSELRAIDLAALEDDEVYRYNKLVHSVDSVDLKDTNIISGICYLVSINILTEKRANEILRIS